MNTRLPFRKVFIAGYAALFLGLAATGRSAEFSYTTYNTVLSQYVDGQGLVNYEGLQKNRAALDAFTRQMSVLSPDIYEEWSRDEKLTFWINAYNALTLVAVIDHYPVKSIKDIGSMFKSVWDKLVFNVMGRELTLNDIEHRVLRTEFDEPRIHMAINCASIGCPTLNIEAFSAEELNDQLEDQSYGFLNTPGKLRYDKKKNTVYLSPIFKWFGDDFKKAYKPARQRAGSETEQAVLEFISRYIPPQQGGWLNDEDLKIKYLDYDWSLNKQKGS